MASYNQKKFMGKIKHTSKTREHSYILSYDFSFLFKKINKYGTETFTWVEKVDSDESDPAFWMNRFHVV